MRPLLTQVHHARRCVHTCTADTRELLRELLRETAQSVAVITALLPSAVKPTYHGATLSSFTSIALDPLPLVAFSLRIPSRMASALNAHVSPTLAPSPPSVHLVINVLSAAQPHLAHRFARPDLHPHPFADPGVAWTLSRDGLPVLSGALGVLSCSLVGPSLPLAHLGGPQDDPVGEGEGELKGYCGDDVEKGGVQQASGLASELFIARVLCVERVSPAPEDDHDIHDELHTLPLLYHRRRYTTVRGDTAS